MVHKQSIEDFSSCRQGNCEAIRLLLSITDGLAAFIGNTASDMVTAPFCK